ncbi:hypothetical protein BH24PSE1_BH24PSE1_07500 [soil metagenome]
MIQRLMSLWRDRRGNVLAIAGAALPLLVGAAGIATDTINWTLWKRELQRAADSAAVAGVYERMSGAVDAEARTAVDHDLTINQHTGMALVSGYPQVVFPADDGQVRNQVQVVLAVRRTLPFSSLFMSEAPLIVARATAASVPGPGDPCIQALETNAGKSGIIITGNAGISMPDCTLHSNSPSTNSAYAKGSSTVTAKAASAVGGIQQSTNWVIDSYDPYAPAIEDPFKDVNPNPSDMKCAGELVTKGGKTDWVSSVLTEDTDLENAKDADGNKANCFASLSVGPSGTLATRPTMARSTSTAATRSSRGTSAAPPARSSSRTRIRRPPRQSASSRSTPARRSTSARRRTALSRVSRFTRTAGRWISRPATTRSTAIRTR